MESEPVEAGSALSNQIPLMLQVKVVLYFINTSLTSQVFL